MVHEKFSFQSRVEFGFFIRLFRERLSGKKVHAAIPKGIMRYDQYTVSDNVAAEPTFSASL